MISTNYSTMAYNKANLKVTNEETTEPKAESQVNFKGKKEFLKVATIPLTTLAAYCGIKIGKKDTITEQVNPATPNQSNTDVKVPTTEKMEAAIDKQTQEIQDETKESHTLSDLAKTLDMDEDEVKDVFRGEQTVKIDDENKGMKVYYNFIPVDAINDKDQSVTVNCNCSHKFDDESILDNKSQVLKEDLDDPFADILNDDKSVTVNCSTNKNKNEMDFDVYPDRWTRSSLYGF